MEHFWNGWPSNISRPVWCVIRNLTHFIFWRLHGQFWRHSLLLEQILSAFLSQKISLNNLKCSIVTFHSFAINLYLHIKTQGNNLPEVSILVCFYKISVFQMIDFTNIHVYKCISIEKVVTYLCIFCDTSAYDKEWYIH